MRTRTPSHKAVPAHSGQGQLRIIGGQWRSRQFDFPMAHGLRPTPNRVRETLFNWLAPYVEGAKVLDVFAGSGALFLEALSRGAAFCLFVETDEAARGAIRHNIESMGLFGATRVHRRDATDLGARPASAGPAFDLAFLDPPYRKALGETALQRLVKGGWVVPGAIGVFERARDEPDPEIAGWTLIDARDYGAARVLFFKAT